MAHPSSSAFVWTRRAPAQSSGLWLARLIVLVVAAFGIVPLAVAQGLAPASSSTASSSTAPPSSASPSTASPSATSPSTAILQTPAVPERVPAVARAGGSAEIRGLVRTGRFASAALGRTMPYTVILPDGYEDSARRYPTLYLLHGLFGAYSDWETRTDIFLASRRYPVIIVMPEGENSWYTDAQGEPAQRFERYLSADLVTHIDETWRTVRSRYARAIAGLSMGGYGALKMALKHPGQFAFAGSLSGAFDAGHDPALDTTFGEKIAVQMRAIYGPADSRTRAENDLYRLLEAVETPASLPFLYFDCGTSDRFLDSNRRFATLLQKKQAAYEYRELPGGHAWDYWERQLHAMLQVLGARWGM